MNQTYYAMKRRLGGEKMTVREKLCSHWYPTPGCRMHEEIIGPRRAEILFKRYCGTSRHAGRNANLMYWRSHPQEWNEISARSVGKK